MFNSEQLFIELLLSLTTADQINTFLGDPRTTAIIVGALVAVSGALLGSFLLLRRMALLSDAISHTVLLGIVVAFLVMVALQQSPDLSSPWLIIGAATAGVATVLLTETLQRSGLLRQDAALGLIFSLLFAIAVILISRYTSNVHLDVHAVTVGEIGVAWANTNSHCTENCDEVVITQDDPRARMGRVCINCSRGGIDPRSPEAVFEERCTNCGTYTAAAAWREGFISSPPTLVFWPRAITVMGLITLLNLGFVLLFYKELKLATFDPLLAGAVGLRPGMLHYALMVLVSITTVGAFDAVGSILVIAFFIIAPAAAYLLTGRLSRMLLASALIGAAAAYTGYDLARGSLLGIVQISDLLRLLDPIIGLGNTTWNTSISASMVMMLFFFFVAAWVLSPRAGLIAVMLRQRAQRQNFAEQLLLGHIYHHQHTADAEQELGIGTVYQHLNWSRGRAMRVITRLRFAHLVRVENNILHLTPQGERHFKRFLQHNLAAHMVQGPESYAPTAGD